jgi:hypothetical protein
MQAVISALDEPHCQMITSLWEELQRAFGIRATSQRVPFPHLTYQGATSYEAEPLHDALQRFATEIAPFEIETDGLGIFMGLITGFPISPWHSGTWAMPNFPM